MTPVPFPAHFGDFFLDARNKTQECVLLNSPAKSWFACNGTEVYWNSNVTSKKMKPCTIRISPQFEEQKNTLFFFAGWWIFGKTIVYIYIYTVGSLSGENLKPLVCHKVWGIQPMVHGGEHQNFASWMAMCWGLPNFYRFHIGKHSLGCLLMLGVRRAGFGISEPKPGVIFFVAPMRSYSRSEHFGSIWTVET